MRREPGAPKKQQLSCRASEALRAFVEEHSRSDNIGRGEIVRDATELYRDLYVGLGADWYEAKKRAGISKQTLGAVLASLVRTALDGERRNNNKKPD